MTPSSDLNPAEAAAALYAWTFLLRFGQYLLLGAPGLLAGVLLAGWLRTPAAHGWLRACLDTAAPRAMLRAAVLGLLTPVTALGALPIADEMLRARIRPAAVVCFLVTAPLFMPWSFGHAADRLGLLSTGLVLSVCLLVGLSAGLAALWADQARGTRPRTRAAPGESVRTEPLPTSAASGESPPGGALPVGTAPTDAARTDTARTSAALCGSAPPAPRTAASPLLVLFRAAANHSAGSWAVQIFLAIGASAALACVLPPGAIEDRLTAPGPATQPGLAVPLALATPDPDLTVVLAGEFRRIGLPAGDILLTFLLGAAWNLGTLAWCLQRLGRAGAVAALTWLALALGAVAAADALPRPAGDGEPDSHAFDLLTRPYHLDNRAPAAAVVAEWRRTGPGGLAALAVLVLLASAGLLERAVRSRRTVAAPGDPRPWLGEPRCSQSAVRAVLGGAAVACCVMSLYSYFPPSDELHARLRLEAGNLMAAVATFDNAERTAGQRAAARAQALHALDRIDDALARYGVSRAMRLQRSRSALLDVAQLRTTTARVRELASRETAAALRPAVQPLVRQLLVQAR